MKSLLPMLVSSFVSLTAVMILLAFVWPQIFFLVPGIVPMETVSQASGETADSSKVSPGSLVAHRGAESSGIALSSEQKKDTNSVRQQKLQGAPASNALSVSAERDSIKALMQTLAQLRERFTKSATERLDTLSEVEAKTMAQIFEAMEPSNAARILNNMDDHAVKQVLTRMKRRQSARVLSALDPQQAARILNVKGEL